MMFAFNIFSAPVWSFVGLCFQKWSGVDRSNCLQTLQKGKRRTMFYSFFFPFSFSPFFLKKIVLFKFVFSFYSHFRSCWQESGGFRKSKKKTNGKRKKGWMWMSAHLLCIFFSFLFLFLPYTCKLILVNIVD